MHSLLILVLILDALIAISSVLNLVNMMRVNLLVEEKQAQALTVQLVRVCKTSAGKGGLLSSWFGVYACPGEIGTGEFTSTNPYSSPEAVPKATTVVPMPASSRSRMLYSNTRVLASPMASRTSSSSSSSLRKVV